MTAPRPDPLGLLGDLVARAGKAGADAADAVLVEGTSLAVAHRLGRLEGIDRSEGYDLGLRVFVGRRSAVVSSNDHRAPALAEVVERALAMARAVPEDDHAGLADPAVLARAWPELDLEDPDEPAAERLAGFAAEAEDAARAVPGVTNSEGAEAGWGRSRVHLVASNGFAGAFGGTSASLGAS
ncbi:MAG: PmbA/TldA family metallopeptidase, partial [Alphaproteobacteria bacterium]